MGYRMPGPDILRSPFYWSTHCWLSFFLLGPVIVTAGAQLHPPDGIAITKLSRDSIRVYWTLRPSDPDTVFTRVTLTPRWDKYRIMADFPLPAYTGTFGGLRDGVYDVNLQSGDVLGNVGDVSPVAHFRLVPLQSLVDYPYPINDTIDWSVNPSSGLTHRAATDEIVIVSLCIIFWIIAVIWFIFGSWAKIRVIEPRYFDYKFMMRYDKAFALRNTVLSASSIRRQSTMTGVGINGPNDRSGRQSFSAVSMRNGGSGEDYDQLPLAFPNYTARRPSCLPGVRRNSRRPSRLSQGHSQEVRIHLDELFEMHEGRIKLARDSVSSV